MTQAIMIDEPTSGGRSSSRTRRRRGSNTGPQTQRRQPTGGGSSGGGGSSRKQVEKKLSMKELAAQYGYAAALFKSDSELEKLIKTAVKEQWSTAKFQARFMDTEWYQEHTASARTWLELEARDPETAQKQVDDQTQAIKRQASQLGISLGTSRARDMARDSLLMGWNENTLTDAIVDEFEYRPGRTSGTTATMETFIKSTAGDYGVQVSNDRVGEWLAKTLRGDFTDEHLADMIRDVARSKYPGLQRYFDQGLTTRDVAEPYLQSYAGLLEVGADSVTMHDPLVQKALQGTTEKNAKKDDPPKLQTLYDFEREVRRDPRWQHTKNARQETMNTTLSILKDWGLAT